MSYLTTVAPIPTATASSSSSSSSTAMTAASRTGPIDPCRLFIGNLSPTVDEYTLIQVFSKCGKIAKMDYLFHKTGPLKGKPRGYAFVEYAHKDDAQKALTKLHSRLLRGRNLVVTQASASPVYDPSKPYKRPGDTNRSTTLSLLKKQGRPQSASAQIAALEAKIASMQNSPLSNSAPGSPRPGSEGGDEMDQGQEGWKSLLEGTELEEPGTSSVGSTEPQTKGKGKAGDEDETSRRAEVGSIPGARKGKEKLHPSLPSKPAPPIGGLGQEQGQRLGGQSSGQGMAHAPRSGQGQGLGHTVGGSSRRGRM